MRQITILRGALRRPCLLLTNDFDSSLSALLRRYARRWLVEKSIAEQLAFFHLNRLSSSLVIQVDFDLAMTVLAYNLLRLLALDLPPGYRQLTARTLWFQGGAFRPAEPESVSGTFRVSLSISPFSGFMLDQGVVFTDGNTTATTLEELQRLYIEHGATELYARLNTRRAHPGGVANHSLARGLEKARLAKRLGIPFNPELGLFCTYGDIRCQAPPDFSDYPEIEAPDSWMSLRLEQMMPLLRQYGVVVAQEILDTGVTVNLWDFGEGNRIWSSWGSASALAGRRCLRRRGGSGVVPPSGRRRSCYRKAGHRLNHGDART